MRYKRKYKLIPYQAVDKEINYSDGRLFPQRKFSAFQSQELETNPLLPANFPFLSI
jgi:hypothetical protein